VQLQRAQGPWYLELPPTYLPAGVIACACVVALAEGLGTWGVLVWLIVTYVRSRKGP
jgi:hypothetical protein